PLYPVPLHDALPIYALPQRGRPKALLLAHVLRERRRVGEPGRVLGRGPRGPGGPGLRAQDLARAVPAAARTSARRHRVTSVGRASTASARLTRPSAAA